MRAYWTKTCIVEDMSGSSRLSCFVAEVKGWYQIQIPGLLLILAFCTGIPPEHQLHS